VRLSFTVAPEQEITNHSIVPIPKGVCFYMDDITNNALDWKTACVDLGINAFYHYTFSSIYGLRHDQTVLAGNGRTTLRPPRRRWNPFSNKMPIHENSFVAISGILSDSRAREQYTLWCG
jgi:hypothetical protein